MTATERRPPPAAPPALLSVIIAAYNAERTLGEQLDSLAAQEYAGAWEVIVVDNRSTDGTAALVRERAQATPHLRLAAAPDRKGQAHARNLGAGVARGDAFIFVDADDVTAPGWLAAFGAALGQHHAVAGSLETKRLNADAVPRPFGYKGVERRALGFLPYMVGCNCGVSRQAFFDVGGFAEDLPPCEDMDFSWRLQLAGYALHYAPEAVVHYRFRKTLRELYSQIDTYAQLYPLLYQRYAPHGMRRATAGEVLRKYWRLVVTARYLVRGSAYHRAEWVYQTAYALGLVRGSLKHRVLYL
jgi:glycosyltransferase involved in cell wall biosynthesis